MAKMNKIEQAVILCGGKGERLKPITNEIPKPLVEINHKSILSYQINYLKRQGITRFIIATGYKSELIENYLDSNFQSSNIKVSNSGEVGIMERIVNCKALLDDKFLLCYGDTLANVDINRLTNFHNAHTGSTTISCFQLQSQFGIVKSTFDNLVTEFQEKPKLDAWINIGYFIFDKNTINNEFSFVEFLSNLALSKNLFSYKHEGLHITVNTIKELKDAEKNIKFFK